MRGTNSTGPIAVVVILLLAGQICFASDSDLQYWTSGGVSLDLSEDWQFSFEEELRFSRDATLFYHHSDAAIVYKGFADWIDVGLNYRQVFSKDSAGDWRQEHRPHLNATLKAKLFDLDVSNRLRVEYRDTEGGKDAWKLRNKFTVKFPVQLTALNIQPYLADEIFIDPDETEINVNRLYAGLSCKFSDSLKGSLYYLWQSKESGGDWDSVNVIGIQLKLNF